MLAAIPVLAHAAGGQPSSALELVAPVLAAAVLGLPYARRARTLARQGRPLPAWRRACYAAGVVVIVVSVIPPVDALSDQLFFAHMAQHLVLGDIGALLLVLGLTGPVLAPLLRVRAIDRLRSLAHPAVGLSLWAGNFYLWHLPALYEAALRHPPVHALQHALFLSLGVNMWLGLLGPLPKPAWFGNAARLGYVVAVRLSAAVLGNVFVWSGTIFYAYYRPGEARRGISAGGDQSIAGALMMLEGSLLTIGLFAWLFLKTAREGEERQELLELAAAREVALTEERATRAVAAGRGDELRRRLAGPAGER